MLPSCHNEGFCALSRRPAVHSHCLPSPRGKSATRITSKVIPATHVTNPKLNYCCDELLRLRGSQSILSAGKVVLLRTFRSEMKYVTKTQSPELLNEIAWPVKGLPGLPHGFHVGPEAMCKLISICTILWQNE